MLLESLNIPLNIFQLPSWLSTLLWSVDNIPYLHLFTYTFQYYTNTIIQGV